MSSPIVKYDWVSVETGERVKEEWHIILRYLYDNYPDTYEDPTHNLSFEDNPFLLHREIAFGVSDAAFDAANESATISVNNNNSPNFYVMLGGRVRIRTVYVQVEFNYRSKAEGSNIDMLNNGQELFSGTKRKIESMLTSNPYVLKSQGLTWINPNPSVLQDGRMFTNFGMVGTLQPEFLETLQDFSKWRYILLFAVEVTEKLI